MGKQKDFDKQLIQNLPEGMYSAADIGNLYMKRLDDETLFVCVTRRLNQKINYQATPDNAQRDPAGNAVVNANKLQYQSKYILKHGETVAKWSATTWRNVYGLPEVHEIVAPVGQTDQNAIVQLVPQEAGEQGGQQDESHGQVLRGFSGLALAWWRIVRLSRPRLLTLVIFLLIFGFSNYPHNVPQEDKPQGNFRIEFLINSAINPGTDIDHAASPFFLGTEKRFFATSVDPGE